MPLSKPSEQEPLVLSGSYIAAVVGTLYSEDYAYGDPNHNEYAEQCGTQKIALRRARKAFVRLKKHNPERVVRLLHRQFSLLDTTSDAIVS